MAEAWFVIETKMRRERESADAIEAMGFECFAPVEVRKRLDRSKHARPMVEYEVAMFPRYIFPRFDIKTPCGWQRIGELRSVHGWLKPAQREEPSPIRSDFIDRVQTEQSFIRAAMEGDHAVKFEPLAKGTRVIIMDGPFRTIGGIVDMGEGERIKIMLDAARFDPIHIDRRSVSAA